MLIIISVLFPFAADEDDAASGENNPMFFNAKVEFFCVDDNEEFEEIEAGKMTLLM